MRNSTPVKKFKSYELHKLYKLVEKHEGLRLKPYRCPAGKLSIGFGRNLDDKGISYNEACELLQRDINDAMKALVSIFGPRFETFGLFRKFALIDMMYNLGTDGFLGFKKMIEAIKKNDWHLAADEAIDSRWFHQVGDRSRRVVGMLRNDKNTFPDYK